ncbi:MAG: type 2 isopentenyl-diphosphate Delta-isomerase [Candidatus Kapaibacterium sp.]|jgi:isopentenyl-diphosphate delta-isomerase
MHNTSDRSSSIPSRKQDHVRIVVEENVGFKSKTAGWELFEPEYNALPELNADHIDLSTSFLGKELRMPLMMTGMTGGYGDAVRINAALARACQSAGIAMGLGSQRQALRSSAYHESFTIARKEAPGVPLLANIGAAEIAGADGVDNAQRVVDLVQADAVAIHLNALQELLQPEGSPTFNGVLAGIEKCVQKLSVPVVVKEVGAGISANVAKRLLQAGVRILDVAGAGGTSWAGVELQRSSAMHMHELWDAGIPTAQCVREVTALRDSHNFFCIASGGVLSGFDAAKALALGADLAGAARPFIKALEQGGEENLMVCLNEWQAQIRATMFIAGVRHVHQLRTIALRDRTGAVLRQGAA